VVRDALNHCRRVVDPTEYMVRAPQRGVYVFLIDVSNSAISPVSKHRAASESCVNIFACGMVATASEHSRNLDRRPNEDNRNQNCHNLLDIYLYFFSYAEALPHCAMVVPINSA